jgi:hypothetical protein
VIGPTHAGFGAVPTSSVPPLAAQPTPSRSKGPIAVIAGLAVVAGILGGVLYAKKSSSPAAPAPSAPAGPVSAQLELAIEPAGSTVEVAGNMITSTKAELAPGVYSIVIKHDGYKPWTSSLTLREGEHQTINVALQPDAQPVAVAVAVTPDAPVAAAVDEPEQPERPDRPTGHKTHHTTQVAQKPDEPEETHDEPAHVEPAHVEPTHVEPVHVEPPTPDPPKPDPVDTKPKATPMVGPSAVTKLSGDVPTLRSKSGDSSDILAKMCIDETGRVTSASIKKSPPEITADLQRALLTWKYKPYVRDGKVSDVCFPLSIRVILKQ